MKSHRPGLVAGALSVLALAAGPASAQGAPVTVELRIEGKTKTLFEGPVTTDERRTFRFSGNATEYICNGTAPAGGSAVPVPTRGAALAEASLRAPFTTAGTFNEQFGSPVFEQIADESVAFDPQTNEFLGEYKNGQFASAGACGDPIASGDRVLFAYGTGSEVLLQLTGPPTGVANPGESVELRVTDAASGQPVADATVSGQRSDAQGIVRVPASQGGETVYKATKTGAVRSNRVVVCATTGQDGLCGTSRPSAPDRPAPPLSSAPTVTPVPARDTARPNGRIIGVREQQAFTRARAPRELAFAASDASGIRQVKLRLTRRARGGRCAYLSKRKDRFVRIRCGRSPALFAASDRADFSYLLPERLTPGRYVLDVIAIDRAGNRDVLARGRSRVVFTVR